MPLLTTELSHLGAIPQDKMLMDVMLLEGSLLILQDMQATMLLELTILRFLSLVGMVFLEELVWHREPSTRETLQRYMAQYRQSHMDLQERHQPLDQHKQQRTDLSSPQQPMVQRIKHHMDLSRTQQPMVQHSKQHMDLGRLRRPMVITASNGPAADVWST